MKTSEDALGRIVEVLGSMRDEMLDRALKDTIAWCGPIDPAARQVSDQHWLATFSQANVSVADAHRFLVTYQLVFKRNWDKERVAATINDVIECDSFLPETDVPALAGVLKGCITSALQSRQTSAASKIAMFARPEAGVHIWDSLATISTRLRSWEREGRRGALDLTRLYKTPEGEHDYVSYLASCRSVLDEERERADFVAIVDAFSDHLQGIGGPMARASRDFIERRVLDKLMFQEGHLVREWLRDAVPSAGLSPIP